MDFVSALSPLYQVVPLALAVGGIGLIFWLIRQMRGGRE